MHWCDMSTCRMVFVCDTIFYLNLSRPALPVSFGPANALSNGHGFQIEHLSVFQCLIWFIPHPHLFLYGIYYVYCLWIVASPSFWLHLKLHNTITSSLVMTPGHSLIQITYFGQSLFTSGLKDRYSDYPTVMTPGHSLIQITYFGQSLFRSGLKDRYSDYPTKPTVLSMFCCCWSPLLA
jgi:hypothetical protein